jgi:hypothetical protein
MAKDFTTIEQTFHPLFQEKVDQVYIVIRRSNTFQGGYSRSQGRYGIVLPWQMHPSSPQQCILNCFAVLRLFFLIIIKDFSICKTKILSRSAFLVLSTHLNVNHGCSITLGVGKWNPLD